MQKSFKIIDKKLLKTLKPIKSARLPTRFGFIQKIKTLLKK